jgi:Flp pilus assembly protein TadB
MLQHFADFFEPWIVLWVPVVVSTAAMFMLSFVFWAALNVHAGDHDHIPNSKENELRDALARLGIGPGSYMFPKAMNHAEASSNEFQGQFFVKPSGTMMIFRKPNMALNMLATAMLFLVICLGVAYVAHLTLAKAPAAASFWQVFRVVFTILFLGCSIHPLINQVWFQSKGRTKVLTVIEGACYAAAAGLVFAWLWPR